MNTLERDPLLYIGVDIGYARDTAAIVAIYPIFAERLWCIFGFCIWTPPVNIPRTVVPALETLLARYRVAAVLYDEYQFVSESQRLADKGFSDRLIAINQQTQMIPAANTLHALCTDRRLLVPPDPELRSHFSWANATPTERGWRIVKRHQAKPIDAVIATAMAVYGASEARGLHTHPSLSDDRVYPSALELL